MITLVLGGARSGKSAVAEKLAALAAAASPAGKSSPASSGGPAARATSSTRPDVRPPGAHEPGAPDVLYLATADAGLAADDPDFAARVAAHQARRPAGWRTVECGAALVEALSVHPEGSALVDSLGTWVAAHPGFDVDADALCAALLSRRGDTVLVSDEVGMGVHPETAVGRGFRDALGSLNQRVAAAADRVWLVVAGRVLDLVTLEDALAAEPPTSASPVGRPAEPPTSAAAGPAPSARPGVDHAGDPS